ncbi:MAG TPA: hypothetical protein VN848_08325 [Gemmatimonadales bacterium]|nr:hypothetical protein [Gemmatimonadales bacterium]
MLGPFLNRTARGWDNFLNRASAEQLARVGTCPWCGRTTTTPARTLLGRFEPTLQRYARSA